MAMLNHQGVHSSDLAIFFPPNWVKNNNNNNDNDNDKTTTTTTTTTTNCKVVMAGWYLLAKLKLMTDLSSSMNHKLSMTYGL